MIKFILSGLAGVFWLLSPMLLNAQCIFTTISSPSGVSPIVTCEGDGNPDIIGFANSSGGATSYAYAISDADFNILEIIDGDSFDFEGSGIGDCLVWGFSYDGDLTGAVGDNVFSTQFASNCWYISSNAIQISRTTILGGTIALANGDAEGFACVSDGIADLLTFSSTGAGTTAYLVVDDAGTIVEVSAFANIDFEPIGIGTFQVYSLAYSGNLTAMIGGSINNDSLSDDCFELSENFIEITSNVVDAGLITTVDGSGYVQIADSLDTQVFNLMTTSTSTANFTYVLTDNTFNIIEILSGNSVDVSGLDIGKYFVWAYSYNGTIMAQIGDSVFAYPFSTGCSAISTTAVVIDKLTEGANGEPICTAFAGTLTIDENPVSLIDGVATVSATSNGNAVVPAGYETMFILTMNEVIVQTGSSSSIEVIMAGDYNLHTLIAETSDATDDDFLDLTGIALGTTTVSDILPAINNICADLDVLGASVTVEEEVVIDPCLNFTGGTVTLDNGDAEATIIIDGDEDVLTFVSTGASGSNFTLAVTDTNGVILSIPTGNEIDFELAGVGVCYVWGIAYEGNLLAMTGDTATLVTIADSCFALSEQFVTVTRNEEIIPGEQIAQFFVSSNTQANVGVFSVFDNDEITLDTFSSVGTDSDGIYYNSTEDVVYQLNRDESVLHAYSNVNANLAQGLEPDLTATSTSDFTNGREVAVSFNRLVVAQDAAPSNNNQNAFVVYTISPTDITLTNTYEVPHNVWGIHAINESLYAIVDNSDSLAIYQNFFSNPSGAINPALYVKVEGIERTHGLTYLSDLGLMILTDVGSGAVDDDGAIVIIPDWFDAISNTVVSMDEQIRIEGPLSLLGNPVDIALDVEQNRVYVAERANGGGRVLGFDIPDASGDVIPFYNEPFAGASAIYLTAEMSTNFTFLRSKFFVSSNTQSVISGIAIYDDGTISVDAFPSAASDGDGIYYDTDLDELYHLNRTDNVINKYEDVLVTLLDGDDPIVNQTSSSDFINGREITVSDDRLVVAQDASTANGMQNRLLVYNLLPTGITLENTYDVDINLWGIQAAGEDLIAVIDNSDSVAIFQNFFANDDGPLAYSAAIQIEGLTRTHGLTYKADIDLMVLTDIGSAMVDDDGGIVVIHAFLAGAIDGVISTDEQIRIAGPSTLLGNPVDVALDFEDDLIYVAERANAGGQILGFENFNIGGDLTPTYIIPYPGVSALHMTEISVLPGAPSNDSSPFANIPVAQETTLKLSVYPNPANDVLNLVWEQSENSIASEVTINLIDLQGRVLYSQQESVTEGQNAFQMSVSHLENGLYTLILNSEDGVQVQRFLKQ